MKSINRIDLLAGLFVILLGGLAIAEALNFTLGTARSMGPGFFPFYIGVLLIILGLVIIVVEGRQPGAQFGQRPALRSVIFVMAAILAFSFLIERVGLAPAVVATVFLSTLVESQFNLVKSITLSIGAAVLAVLIFDIGLSLQVDAFRWR